MALAHIVHQVLQAFGNALALGLNRLFLRISIHCQKVTGGAGGHPLLDSKANAGTGLFITVDGLCQAHQGAGVKQVSSGGESRHGVAGPGIASKAAVLDRQLALHALVPKLGRLVHVLLLQGFELLWVETDVGGGVGQAGELGHGRHARNGRHLH